VSDIFVSRSGANGECKVESDADVSGALDPVGIEDIDSEPYLVAGWKSKRKGD
jgi:hypothetical protein